MGVNIIHELYIDALMIYHDILSCLCITRKREPIMYDDDGEIWEHV